MGSRLPGGRARHVGLGPYGAVALGGAFGATARYEVAQVIASTPAGFPVATLVTNVSGSLLLGAVLALILERFPPTRYLRPFLATGFCGGYTTYSTFAIDSDLLVKAGHWLTALAYVAASLAAGLAATWVGMWMGRPPSPARHLGGNQ